MVPTAPWFVIVAYPRATKLPELGIAYHNANSVCRQHTKAALTAVASVIPALEMAVYWEMKRRKIQQGKGGALDANTAVCLQFISECEYLHAKC